MDDVLLNKAGIVERCLRRVREEYAGDPSRLLSFTHQDAIVLNLERAGLLSTATTRRMGAMVGFRNVAVHEYQALDIEILRDICETRHLDFVDLCAELGLKIVP